MRIFNLGSSALCICEQTELIINQNFPDYFSVETTDYESDAVFVIPKFETEIYKIFKELLDDIFTLYMQSGFNKMGRIEPLERSILAHSDTTDGNVLVIEEDGEKEAILITILRNPKCNHRNNRIILDRDGALFMGYYEAFATFYSKLSMLARKKPNSGGRRLAPPKVRNKNRRK